MELKADFMEQWDRTYTRDVVVMAIALISAIGLCAYHLHLRHSGMALLFAIIGFVDGASLLFYRSMYKGTKRLFEVSEEMVLQMLKEIEEETDEAAQAKEEGAGKEASR